VVVGAAADALEADTDGEPRVSESLRLELVVEVAVVSELGLMRVVVEPVEAGVVPPSLAPVVLVGSSELVMGPPWSWSPGLGPCDSGRGRNDKRPQKPAGVHSPRTRKTP
jgi:hypothetical protein